MDKNTLIILRTLLLALRFPAKSSGRADNLDKAAKMIDALNEPETAPSNEGGFISSIIGKKS